MGIADKPNSHRHFRAVRCREGITAAIPIARPASRPPASFHSERDQRERGPQVSESANAVQPAMSDLAIQPQRSPAPTAKPPKITGKVAAAIERMVELGEPFNEAAQSVGLTVRAMRKALDKAHVIQHLRARKQVFREAASAGNIRRLVQIRDAADNMPAVNAIKALEQIGDEAAQPGRSAAVPGLVIMIQGGPYMPHIRQDQPKPLITLGTDSLSETDESKTR